VSQFKLRTIDSYLINKLLFIFLSFTSIFLIILFTNQFLVILKFDFAFFNTYEVIKLLVLKSFTNLPFVLSMSFFLSLVYLIKSLYENSEFVILNSHGYGYYETFKTFKNLILVFFSFIALLALQLVPATVDEINNLRSDSQRTANFFLIKEGVFTELNNFSIFVEKVENKQQNFQFFRNVWVFPESDDSKNIKVIYAESGTKEIDKNRYLQLTLNNGSIYTISELINIANFETYKLNSLNSNINQKIDKSTDSMGLWDLLDNTDSNKSAELYWRFMQPLIFCWSVIYAIINSSETPRKRSKFKIITSFIVFVSLYVYIVFFKTFIINEEINLINALFLSNFLLAVFIIAKYFFKHKRP